MTSISYNAEETHSRFIAEQDILEADTTDGTRMTDHPVKEEMPSAFDPGWVLRIVDQRNIYCLVSALFAAAV